MKPNQNVKRSRGQRHNPRRNAPNPRSSNFDSNGPSGRVRGNAQQVYDKYIALARDAAVLDDNIKAENYLQHAEHYFRIMAAYKEQSDDRPEQRQHDERPEQRQQDERIDQRPRDERPEQRQRNERIESKPKPDLPQPPPSPRHEKPSETTDEAPDDAGLRAFLRN
ncbi:MAG: DUF4167 domain-containing protein [Pseudomonadota bacterium]|nr:DUF4167 domain-containing protein [Pseudomonadota bacterium]